MTTSVSHQATVYPLDSGLTSRGVPQAIELEDLSQTIETFADQTVTGPPIDGGYAAWRLLLSAFVFESLLWGFPVNKPSLPPL